jgi:RNA-directed DNA polymerase
MNLGSDSQGGFMDRLLKKAASPSVLNHAWKKLRNDHAMWQHGLSREELNNNFAYHLLKLSEELGSGKYKPGSVRFFPVKKGDGSQRIISAVTLRDKLAQRAVLTVIEPFGEAIFHENSYAYRPNRNIGMAHAKCREYMTCGLKWVLDADITGFFDNIPHAPLIKKVRALIKDSDMLDLIKQWLDTGTPRRGFLSQPKGIPQGSLLSPFLCNIYLNDFDKWLADKNLAAVRYADDFIVFTKTESDAQAAHGCVEKLLRSLELELNPQKTKVSLAGPNVTFLGKKLSEIR